MKNRPRAIVNFRAADMKNVDGIKKKDCKTGAAIITDYDRRNDGNFVCEE